MKLYAVRSANHISKIVNSLASLTIALIDRYEVIRNETWQKGGDQKFRKSRNRVETYGNGLPPGRGGRP